MGVVLGCVGISGCGAGVMRWCVLVLVMTISRVVVCESLCAAGRCACSEVGLRGKVVAG